jgi:hypothetical protein
MDADNSLYDIQEDTSALDSARERGRAGATPSGAQ